MCVSVGLADGKVVVRSGYSVGRHRRGRRGLSLAKMIPKVRLVVTNRKTRLNLRCNLHEGHTPDLGGDRSDSSPGLWVQLEDARPTRSSESVHPELCLWGLSICVPCNSSTEPFDSCQTGNYSIPL